MPYYLYKLKLYELTKNIQMHIESCYSIRIAGSAFVSTAISAFHVVYVYHTVQSVVGHRLWYTEPGKT